MIDLRSDTVTKPTEGMLQAMFSAPVGDDVFGEDPTINQLEQMVADMFGMEAGIFCPSGTMTNQIAIKLHTQPGDEVICEQFSHIYQYEGGGIAYNSGCSVRLLIGDRGRLTADQVEEAINPDDVHKPHTSLVSLENTCNRGGGSCYDWKEMEAIKEICLRHGLSYHIDGARLFNAIVAKQENPLKYGAMFDTISICLSKGLGTPVGSVLIGSKAHIKKARRIRKVFGGGMRQAGYLAAAGIYALEHNVERLNEDHTHAQILAAALAEKDFVSEVLPVETNIIIAQINGRYTASELVKKMKEEGVMVMHISTNQIRLVLHLGISIESVNNIIKVISDL